MARHVVLLRGVNVGAHNRLRMADLRDALTARGLEDVVTQGQSGNVLVTGAGRPGAVAELVQASLAEDLAVPVKVVVRTVAEVRRAVDEDPLAGIADDPSKHFIVFLAHPPAKAEVRRVEAADVAPDRVAFGRREAYLWCPNGLRDSKLGRLKLDESLGVTGTARNTRTVGKLLAMADG
jgi:uncharacterized protein (DUF1697 family)